MPLDSGAWRQADAGRSMLAILAMFIYFVGCQHQQMICLLLYPRCRNSCGRNTTTTCISDNVWKVIMGHWVRSALWTIQFVIGMLALYTSGMQISCRNVLRSVFFVVFLRRHLDDDKDLHVTKMLVGAEQPLAIKICIGSQVKFWPLICNFCRNYFSNLAWLCGNKAPMVG